jgi:hypothetical protein
VRVPHIPREPVHRATKAKHSLRKTMTIQIDSVSAVTEPTADCVVSNEENVKACDLERQAAEAESGPLDVDPKAVTEKVGSLDTPDHENDMKENLTLEKAAPEGVPSTDHPVVEPAPADSPASIEPLAAEPAVQGEGISEIKYEQNSTNAKEELQLEQMGPGIAQMATEAAAEQEAAGEAGAEVATSEETLETPPCEIANVKKSNGDVEVLIDESPSKRLKIVADNSTQEL